jgi:hypothetical protein
VPLSPDLQHRRMITGPDRHAGRRAQRGNGHRAGIVGVVLVHRAGGRQPHPRGQPGLDIRHLLPGCEQLPGQQVPRAAGALHRPGPLRPGRRPLRQPPRLHRRGPYPHLAGRLLIRADRHRGVRALVRAGADHHCRHDPPPSLLLRQTGPWRACLIPDGTRRASFEPRHGKTRQAGTSFGSQASKAAGSGSESQTCRAFERYDLDRNALQRFFNKADLTRQRRPVIVTLSNRFFRTRAIRTPNRRAGPAWDWGASMRADHPLRQPSAVPSPHRVPLCQPPKLCRCDGQL